MFVDWQLFRRRALLTSAAAATLVLLIWNIPALDFALYPFRLFVTFIHEAGHGLAALLTGGEFIRFQVGADGSGLATTRGGIRAIILPAGYLGSALFGTALFYTTNRVPYPRLIAFGLGAALAALSILFGQTSQVALTVGVAYGVALGIMGLLATRYLTVFVLNLLAIMTALNAVLDLFSLTRNTAATTPDGRILNDAAAFASQITPNISPVVWAWVWALLSALLLGTAVYRAVLRPLLTTPTIIRPPQRHDQPAPNGTYYEDTLYDRDLVD